MTRMTIIIMMFLGMMVIVVVTVIDKQENLNHLYITQNNNEIKQIT